MKFFLLWNLLILAAQAEPLVDTLTGRIQGFSEDGVSTYLGIPFAEPPVGALRFRRPLPKNPWTGTKLATEFASMCVQLLGSAVQGSEDCLYLNVWVPKSNEPLPVMVFFHGGGLMFGSTDDELSNGKELALREKVIVVSVAYRVGALGYLAHPALSAETSYHGSGNYGLMDQIAGYLWVLKNISRFGGDRKRVTIFGQSSGASSVCAILSSPLSRSFVQAAIMQSQWCQSQTLAQAESKGVLVSNLAGCPGFDEDTATCLRTTAPENLTQIPPYLLIDPNSFLITFFTLTVDHYSLLEPPIDSVRYGRAADVPVIIGATSLDGGGLSPLIVRPDSVFQSMTTIFGPYGRALIQTHYGISPKESHSALHASNILNDFLFYCQARRMARLRSLSSISPTYVYIYDHILSVEDVSIPPFHASDLIPIFEKVSTPEDLKVQRFLSGAWGAFARNRTPNDTQLPLWEPLSLVNERTMRFTPKSNQIYDYRAERCRFVEAMLERAGQ